MVKRLKLRWKLLIMIMPLVLIPMIMATVLVSYVAIKQIHQEVGKANRADLEHMSVFTLDLIDNYYRQHQLYEQELLEERRRKLKDLVTTALNLVESHYSRAVDGDLPEQKAKLFAYKSLKRAETGSFGYFYVMDSSGTLVVHPDLEGENIINRQDETGRRFIYEISRNAVESEHGETSFITYPWKVEGSSSLLREKEAAYQYFRPWDWVIAAGSYVEDINTESFFTDEAFVDLKKKITGKPVNTSGRIYVIDCSGNLVLHPGNEKVEDALNQEFDQRGRNLTAKLCKGETTTGWLNYFPQSSGAADVDEKLARLSYFSPLHWIVVVEIAEKELMQPARAITGRILTAMAFMIIIVGALAVMFAFLVAKIFTDPILAMTSAMRRVKSGYLEERLPVVTEDELGEMAMAFNQMSEMLEHDLAVEEKLTEQQKMASLGVFSAEVAHEINNPMGIILGYACHLETKMSPDDPRYHFVQEIRSESKRCVGILNDLLRYARLPEPRFQPTDLVHFVDQIMEFAQGHKDLKKIYFRKMVSSQLPEIMLDRDQIRQVVMNLALNAAAAMPEGGEIVITLSNKNSQQVSVTFTDSGTGIDPGIRDKIFEPFFSTRSRGTGLGLAISKQIVEAHLGSIEVESVPGAGTSVHVYLPIKQD